MIIDTHIHLDDARYRDDLNAVLSHAKEEGVQRFIIPGADPKTIARAVEIAEHYDAVYIAVGVHPYDLEAYDTDTLLRYIEHPKCVAVGECGLDYYRLEGSSEAKEREKVRQKTLFRTQIALAKEYGKPLIVHIRDASSDAKSILEEEGAAEVGGVLHCYNADEQLLSLADQGFYFGIGGVVTFKNARKLINVLPKIPQNRLLIETDGPYLTPHPHRGERNEPAYTKLIAEKMAELLALSCKEIEALTTRNAVKLFGF